MNKLLKKVKGFTLIEVVIVLAIAGLIFVIVFLAVGQAQKSRRDTQRKNDLSRIAATLDSYASNNNGDLPSNADFTNSASTYRTQYVAPLNLKDPVWATEYAYTTSALLCTGWPGGVQYTRTNDRLYTIKMCLEAGEVTRSNL